MKVLLLEKVKNLGNVGSLVTVRDGFARNYLLAKRKAVRSTKENEEKFNNERKGIEKANIDKKNLALRNSEILKGQVLTIVMQAGDDRRLYGSVTNKDVARLIMSKFQINVAVENIRLNKKIKDIGCYKITIVLHSEIESEIKLSIGRSLEEAKTQIKHD